MWDLRRVALRGLYFVGEGTYLGGQRRDPFLAESGQKLDKANVLGP
jgi:hypothetical protein